MEMGLAEESIEDDERGLGGVLGVKKLRHSVESVDLFHRLVGAESQDAGEAERVAAIVAIALHHVVEGDFDDDFRLDNQLAAVGFQGVIEEPLGHGEDFFVREAAVGFADIAQAFAISHGEGVVAQNGGATSVAVLDSGHDDIQGGQLALELDPCGAAAAGLIGGFQRLEHEAFVAARLGCGEGFFNLLRRSCVGNGGQFESCGGVLADL